MCAFPPLRTAAIKRAYELVVMEDENTAYQTIAPVSKMFNQIARFHQEGSNSDAYRQHMLKRRDFMWLGSEGMMVCGTNGSQLWDTAFIAQAVVETGLAYEEDNKDSILKTLRWLDDAQIQENPRHFHTAYRHQTKGGWGFRSEILIRNTNVCTNKDTARKNRAMV